jgi:hypothetical protein
MMVVAHALERAVPRHTLMGTPTLNPSNHPLDATTHE